MTSEHVRNLGQSCKTTLARTPISAIVQSARIICESGDSGIVRATRKQYFVSSHIFTLEVVIEVGKWRLEDMYATHVSTTSLLRCVIAYLYGAPAVTTREMLSPAWIRRVGPDEDL